MLEDFIIDPNITGIVLPSILGLTEDKERRDYLFNLALETGTHLLFADESIYLNNGSELNYINEIFEYINNEDDPDLLLGHTRTTYGKT